MLNQVPRTLLNIGIDPVDQDPGLSPPFDRNSLTLDGESKGGDGSAPSHGARTPHYRHSGASPAGLRSDEGSRADGAPGPLPSTRSSAGKDWSWGRGSGNGRDEESGPSTPGGKVLRSTFTNESIADQALKDFGDGDVSVAAVGLFGNGLKLEGAIRVTLLFPGGAWRCDVIRGRKERSRGVQAAVHLNRASCGRKRVEVGGISHLRHREERCSG